jgi:hypothetical protein
MVPPLRGATRLCRVPECGHQVEPAAASLRAAVGGTSADPAEMAERYGPETPVADWHKRLVCSRCGAATTPKWS